VSALAICSQSRIKAAPQLERVYHRLLSEVYVSDWVSSEPQIFWDAFTTVELLDVLRCRTADKSETLGLLVPIGMFKWNVGKMGLLCWLHCYAATAATLCRH
jgi:hypothetical protein